MWQDIVDKKAEFIGGMLYEFDRIMGEASTKITDLKLERKTGQDGEEYVTFCVYGVDFNMTANVKYFGISGSSRFGGLPLVGTWGGGDSWEIVKRKDSTKVTKTKKEK